MSITVSRRQFLAATAVVGVAPGLALALPAASGFKIGCYTRCFDQFDLKDALDGIAEAGYKYAGIMTAKVDGWVVVTPNTHPDEASRLGAEVTKRGLKTISLYADYVKQAGEGVEQAVQALKRLIDNCKACGSPHLLLGGTNDEKVFQNYYKAVSECCPIAAEKGITISIKPHGGQNSTGPQCRKIIEQVNQKNFRLWYDPGNIFYYSDGKLDPIEDSKLVDGLVCGVSIKDFKPPKEVLVTPGSGVVDFPKVMRNLRKGGLTSGPLVVECVERGERKAVVDEARRARLFLEQLISEF
jgi:sugar phosphate isomerase/epimerase